MKEPRGSEKWSDLSKVTQEVEETGPVFLPLHLDEVTQGHPQICNMSLPYISAESHLPTLNHDGSSLGSRGPLITSSQVSLLISAVNMRRRERGVPPHGEEASTRVDEGWRREKDHGQHREKSGKRKRKKIHREGESPLPKKNPKAKEMPQGR